jgi:SPP1 family predicted phage head-tail adaptor
MDKEITLIPYTVTKDDLEQDIETPGNPISVFGGVKDISQTEFYKAAQSEYKPSIKIVLWIYDYNQEKEFQYDGNTYRVLRKYRPEDSEFIELTGEEVTG